MELFRSFLENNKLKNSGFAGLTDELFSVLLKEIFEYHKRGVLVVTSSLFEANKIYELLLNHTEKALLFPMDDFLTSEAVAISPDLMIERLEVLNHLIEDSHYIVITNLMGYLRYLPTKEAYQKSFIDIRISMDFPPEVLISQLVDSGYKRETIVTRTGEFAVRGFVLDIFPIGEEYPVRIEFFGDTVDSIRYFDAETQMSTENIDKTLIKPFSEFLTENTVEEEFRKQKFLPKYANKVVSLYQYFDNAYLCFKDFRQLQVGYQSILEEVLQYKTDKDKTFHGEYFHSFCQVDDALYYLSVDNIAFDSSISVCDFNAKSVPLFHENLEAIHKYLREALRDEKTVILCLKEYQIKNFCKHLQLPFVISDISSIVSGKINVVDYSMQHGFTYLQYVFLTDQDLFHVREERKRHKSSFQYASKIRDINKLEIGDYVVHDIHGIGIYQGIQTLTHGDVKKDYIVVFYEGQDKLYIPVEKIDFISKYSGREGVGVKVNKLGGSEWTKVKSRVRKRIQDVANQLLKIYAEREMKKGFMFQKDTELQRNFEEEFVYEETKDQLRAVEDIKQDMESSKPMDRLLCGDVGYGKTEVAFRAIFKAVMDSKQVLYLCPTTILSNQHYKNAIVRFANYPIRIGLLNRFTTPKEVKRILSGLENGEIDVVFGTHRLLSQDVKPKDLGLLIIDEEQRFGVMHKEKIKEYKANVDVLTLTATPIPRTLQMSMVGIRSLSLITTPPVNRYPVQTYVIEENKQIIRDAIYKELSRNGQVFILYNRVESIEKEVYSIQSLVPEAKIIFAHGKMTKQELESKMIDFTEHKADILVCTTIIETGIDIPNVNTLIILDADRFGLSQLYQIRGRVGRSNKIAYAYLMYTPGKVLNEIAMKRLNVIKEFTELGSGFSIATRDLSIRGAGDILGSEQAGFIDSVGIDLYLKMLNDEVSRLKGITPIEEELREEKPLLNVTTHISDEYVSDVDLKIEIHRKINEIDSYEKLVSVQNELRDRFGKLEEDMVIYMYEEWFEKLARKLEIVNVRTTRNSIELIFSPEVTSRIDGEKLFEDAFHITTMFRFKLAANSLHVILDTIQLEKHYIYYLIDLLKTIELTYVTEK